MPRRREEKERRTSPQLSPCLCVSVAGFSFCHSRSFAARRPQPSGLNTRTADAGYAVSLEGGRMGRGVRLPPQLGQTPCSLASAQSRQNVHSKVQIIASGACGGRSFPQHSQLGRSSSIGALFKLYRPTRDTGAIRHPVVALSHSEDGCRGRQARPHSRPFAAQLFLPIRVHLSRLAVSALIRGRNAPLPVSEGFFRPNPLPHESSDYIETRVTL